METKIHFRVHNSPPPVLTLSQMNPLLFYAVSAVGHSAVDAVLIMKD
jgi:hypothetical protein